MVTFKEGLDLLVDYDQGVGLQGTDLCVFLLKLNAEPFYAWLANLARYWVMGGNFYGLPYQITM